MQLKTTTQRRPLRALGASGCLTCRIRKIKCDEARPSCTKCLSTGRACDGYSILPFSRTELLEASKRQGHGSRQAAGTRSLLGVMLVDGAFRNKLEQRYFQFFRCCTVACTSMTVDAPFWDRVILQAFHTEPAVKHAILALSAIHSCILDYKDKHSSKQHILYAREQYTVALGEARRLVEDAQPTQIPRILMVCLLFVAWEGIQGNYNASQKHMDSGRALLSRFHNQVRSKASLSMVVSDIMQVLARMDIAAIAFSDDTAPYRPPLDDSVDTILCYIQQPFSSLRQASAALMEIARQLLRLGSEAIIGTDVVEQTRQRNIFDEYSQHLSIWEIHWDAWLANNKSTSGSLSALNVELWQACANALVASDFIGPELRYDDALSEFHGVVESAEKLAAAIFQDCEFISFSLDLGYLVPTFFAATRCRDSGLRHRALEVLRRYPRHEGAWQSGPAAVIAGKWIEIEEAGLVSEGGDGPIPEHRRVAIMEVQVEKSSGSARLRFQLSDANGEAPVLEELVTF